VAKLLRKATFIEERVPTLKTFLQVCS